MKRLWHDENGMTLTEVIVAMALLSIVILTAFNLLSTGIGVDEVNNERTLALNLAEELMEECKHQGVTTAQLAVGDPLQPETQESGIYKKFNSEVTVMEYTPDPSTDIDSGTAFAQITVKVWTDDKTKPEAQLDTVVKVRDET